MKFLLLFAVKSVLKHKRRTILTFTVLSVGIAFYIVMVGMVEGYKKQSIENFINFDTAHLQVRTTNFSEDTPSARENYFDPEPVLDVLRNKPYVTASAVRIRFSAEADNGRDSTPCLVVGVDPANDPKVFNLTNYLTSGGFRKGGAVVGSGLAQDFGLEIGDEIYITFRNGQDTIDSVGVSVTGIVSTGDPIVNNSTLYVPLDDARRYLNTPNVTQIAVKTDNLRKDRGYRADLVKSLPGLDVVSWRKLSESIVAASQADTVTTYIFVVFILIIALVGIINTMLMSVYEKTQEIGTLKAMGMEDGDVLKLFMMEGTIIGLAGGLAGVMLGVLVNWYFVSFGYDMTAMMGQENENMMAAYRLMGVLYSTWDIPSIIAAVVMSIATSLGASYFPAKKATRLEPVECLRTIQ